jgi:hypothetical protein
MPEPQQPTSPTLLGCARLTPTYKLINATGTYVQVNSGEIRSLDQPKIIAALAASGSDGDLSEIVLKRVNVMLDAESLRIAAHLGGGNVSAGIRVALRGNHSWSFEK